jgi:hypothetical protein
MLWSICIVRWHESLTYTHKEKVEKRKRNTDRKQEWCEQYHFASVQEPEYKVTHCNSAVVLERWFDVALYITYFKNVIDQVYIL